MTVDPTQYRLGIEGPPNPEGLTEHIMLSEQGESSPDKGLSVFYGIAHQTEDLPDHKAFVDAVPDVESDIGGAVVRSARTGLSPYTRDLPSGQVITYSRQLGPTDVAVQILGIDDDRRLAVVSVVPTDYSATGAIAFLSRTQVQSVSPIGAVVCVSAVPQSMVRKVTTSDELWVVLDPASKACWVSVYIERYTNC